MKKAFNAGEKMSVTLTLLSATYFFTEIAWINLRDGEWLVACIAAAAAVSAAVNTGRFNSRVL